MQAEFPSLMELLTPRQFSVAILLAWGLKNAEIATRLGTTEYTIKNYVREIYDRAGCWNRVELAVRYVYEVHIGRYDRERLADFLTKVQVVHSTDGFSENAVDSH